jgi:hypothetical protein
MSIMESLAMNPEQSSGESTTPPLMTVERFAEWIGLPVGVCEAQADRRYWPVKVVGKRRFINVELVRKQALEAESNK